MIHCYGIQGQKKYCSLTKLKLSKGICEHSGYATCALELRR